MKWTVVTIILGYIIIWQLEQVLDFIFPIAFLFIFSYVTYLYWKRIEILPTFVEKSQAIFSLIVGTVVLLFCIWLLVESQAISIWYYPLIFGVFVLFRGVFRFIINLTVKEPKSFGISSETEKGDIVRSKSEKKVADWLYENNIEYEYERKIELPDNETILSDFYLTKADIYVEYWGLSSADNETGEKYRERKQKKIELYEKYNYKLMSIYPHHLYELDRYIPEQIDLLTGQNRGIVARIRRLFFGSDEKKSVERPSSNPTEKSIFCTNCGSSVTAKGEYCVKCGTLVE